VVKPSRAVRNREKSGFTLIELMIVVVILGVLAAVAVMSYRIYIQRARTSEAAGLLANIKAAQESYRSEFGMYCNVFGTDAAGSPTGAPGPSPVAWTTATANAVWTQLGFRPDNLQVFFLLNTVAGAPNAAIPAGWTGAGAITLPTADATFIQDYWFLARAQGDLDGDGSRSLFWITHMTTGVDRLNPVE